MSYHFAGRLAAFGIIGMLAVGAHAQTNVLNVSGGPYNFMVNSEYDSLFTLQMRLVLSLVLLV